MEQWMLNKRRLILCLKKFAVTFLFVETLIYTLKCPSLRLSVQPSVCKRRYGGNVKYSANIQDRRLKNFQYTDH